MPALQGAVRLFCSHFLQLFYLIVFISHLVFLQPNYQEAPRSAVLARLLQAVPGGTAQSRGPAEAAVPHLRPEGVHLRGRSGLPAFLQFPLQQPAGCGGELRGADPEQEWPPSPPPPLPGRSGWRLLWLQSSVTWKPVALAPPGRASVQLLRRGEPGHIPLP